jgi:hypothetical protein
VARARGSASEARKRALALLAQVLSDPQKRRAFADDPAGTLETELGDAKNDLPPKVRAFFSDLTYEELRVLAQLQKTMKGIDGLSEDVSTDDTVFSLAKF